MSFSNFHVWAIVLLSVNMQNKIVNQFRHRSEAEECMRLLRRSNPDKDYEIMYNLPQKKSIVSVESQSINTTNEYVQVMQVTNDGSETTEIVWYRPEYKKPQEIMPVLGIYKIDGELTTEEVCLGLSGIWWIDNCKSVDPPLWWTIIPLPTTE